MRQRYTVLGKLVGADIWHLTVRELPGTWTVAFSTSDIERRARLRIALDERRWPTDFDVTVERSSDS